MVYDVVVQKLSQTGNGLQYVKDYKRMLYMDMVI